MLSSILLFYKNIFKNTFGSLQIPAISLHQFFSYHLSRKAEGNGPLKPWQPIRILLG